MSGTNVAKTGGDVFDTGFGWHGRKGIKIRERVALTSAATNNKLAIKLPARSRIVWATIAYATAPSFTWAATHNSPTGAVILTKTAPTSVDVTATTDILLRGSTTLTANTKARDEPENTAQAKNTGTTEQTLYLMPFAATTSASNTDEFSTSYSWGGTADIDVQLYVDKFDDTDDA